LTFFTNFIYSWFFSQCFMVLLHLIAISPRG
jgi:hypothetical protein